MNFESIEFNQIIPELFSYLSQTDQWNLSRTCKYNYELCRDFQKSPVFCKNNSLYDCATQWHVLCLSKAPNINESSYVEAIHMYCTQTKITNPAAMHKTVRKNASKLKGANNAPEFVDDCFSYTAHMYAIIELVKYIAEINPVSDERVIQERLVLLTIIMREFQKNNIETIVFYQQ